MTNGNGNQGRQGGRGGDDQQYQQYQKFLQYQQYQQQAGYGGQWGGGQWGGGQWGGGGGQWGSGQWGGNTWNRSPQQGDCTVRVGRVSAVTPGSVPTMRNITLYFGRPFGPNLPEFSLTYQNVGSSWPIFESQVNTLWECQVRYVGAPGGYTMELCQDRPPRSIGACPMTGYEEVCQGVVGPAQAPAAAVTGNCASHYAMWMGFTENIGQGRVIDLKFGGGNSTPDLKYVRAPPLPGDEDWGQSIYDGPVGSLWRVGLDGANKPCGPPPKKMFDKCGRRGVVGEWYPLCDLLQDAKACDKGPYHAMLMTNNTTPGKESEVTLKVKVGAQLVDKKVKAPASHALTLAVQYSVFTVFLDKDGNVCLDKVAYLPKQCVTAKDYEGLCALDQRLNKACEGPFYAMMMTDPATLTKGGDVQLKVQKGAQVLPKTVKGVKPGDELARGPQYSVWKVHLNKKDGSVCLDPKPEFHKGRCASASELPICAQDPGMGCKPYPAIVTANDKKGKLQLVFLKDKKEIPVAMPVPDNQLAFYWAEPYSIWNVALDAKNKPCLWPAPAKIKDCAKVTDHPLCKKKPEFSCKMEYGLIKSNAPQTSTKTSKVTIMFNPKGTGQFAAVFDAPAGHPLLYAKAGEIWKVYVDSTRKVCPLPYPERHQTACLPSDPLPVCGPGCKDAKPTRGVVTEVSNAGGKCILSVAYVTNDTTKKVAVGKAEMPATANCGAFKPGQGLMVLRHPQTGAFCGVQEPVQPENSYCAKAANEEVCKWACEKKVIQCDTGCPAEDKKQVPAIALENPASSDGQYTLTFMYPKEEGSSIGTLRTTDPNAQYIKKGQAYQVFKNKKTDLLCELGPVSPIIDFCADPLPEYKPLCKAACQYIPGLCSPATQTPGPNGPDGGGLDLSNMDIKVRLGNQNKGNNANRAGGGGVPGGPYFGPGGLLYPGGNGFILPPEKYVLPVPVATDTHIIGGPRDEVWNGEGPHGRRWNPDDPPVPNPTATPEATFAPGGEEEDDTAPLAEPGGGGPGVGVAPDDGFTGAPAQPAAPALSLMPPPPPQQPAYPRWWVWIAVAVTLLLAAGLWWWYSDKRAQNNSEAVIFM